MHGGQARDLIPRHSLIVTVTASPLVAPTCMSNGGQHIALLRLLQSLAWVTCTVMKGTLFIVINLNFRMSEDRLQGLRGWCRHDRRPTGTRSCLLRRGPVSPRVLPFAPAPRPNPQPSLVFPHTLKVSSWAKRCFMRRPVPRPHV